MLREFPVVYAPKIKSQCADVLCQRYSAEALSALRGSRLNLLGAALLCTGGDGRSSACYCRVRWVESYATSCWHYGRFTEAKNAWRKIGPLVTDNASRDLSGQHLYLNPDDRLYVQYDRDRHFTLILAVKCRQRPNLREPAARHPGNKMAATSATTSFAPAVTKGEGRENVAFPAMEQK